MKKIAIGIVSDREGSNSVYAANVFKALAEEADYSVTVLDFSKAHLEFYCDMRQFGQHHYPDDDFIPLLEKIMQADAFVMFSPIYWSFYPAKYKMFLDRFSEAMRRKELQFTERMTGKPWANVLVSAGHPDFYRDAFWTIHESLCRYAFVNAEPVRGPWFIANGAGELEAKQSDFVRQELAELLSRLM